MIPMQLQSLKSLRLTVEEEMHLQEIHYMTFDLELGQSHAKSSPVLPHYVTYAATTFEVATSNGLGGGTFTIKYIL